MKGAATTLVYEKSLVLSVRGKAKSSTGEMAWLPLTYSQLGPLTLAHSHYRRAPPCGRLQAAHLACIVIPTRRMRQVNLLANDAEKLLFAMFSFNLGWTAPVMIVFSLFGLVREARMASAMSR